MAWNPTPEVATARDIARKWNMQQVIIFVCNDDTGGYRTVSYGSTRHLCDHADKIAEAITEAALNYIERNEP